MTVSDSNFWRGVYYRQFFKCKEDDCGFMFTTLFRPDDYMELEGGCPKCGMDNVDYAIEKDRTAYVKKLTEEFEVMQKVGMLNG